MTHLLGVLPFDFRVQEPPSTFTVEWQATGFVVAGLVEGGLDSDAIKKAFAAATSEPRFAKARQLRLMAQDDMTLLQNQALGDVPF